MSALVGYGSSDEEEDDIEPEKPAKIARLENDAALQQANEVIGAHTAIAPADDEVTAASPYTAPMAAPAARTDHDEQAPQPGPSLALAPAPEATGATSPTSPPTSPYTTERLLIRNLTMPPIPNFDIPDEPPPPPPNSEAAATLAARTKKFEHFLELKRKGVHFNQRLQDSSSLRNPSLLPKLMEFAGISKEGSYASTLSVEQGGVPVKWPEEWFVENLVKGNERREKKARGERKGVEFVGAKSGKEAGSGGESGSNKDTPSGSSTGGKKSRFDQR